MLPAGSDDAVNEANERIANEIQIADFIFQRAKFSRHFDIIMELAKLHASYDPNPITKTYVEELIKKAEGGDDEANKEIVSRFGKELKFGTSGLRGEMGPGSARMNDLVVIQATQGLYSYLKDTIGEETLKQKGVVIGFDHRADTKFGVSSKKMAQFAVAIFLDKGVKTVSFLDFVHTPTVPFSVLHVGAAAGVMVTASHNPKQDDGYKVYWDNGASILNPHDVGIQNARTANKQPWKDYTKDATEESIVAHPNFVNGASLIDAYVERVASKLCFHRAENNKSQLKVAYTAMHGVGTPFVERVFEAFGHPAVIKVEEQCDPDPTFPTVPFPNPEEPNALNLAIATADKHNCSLVIACDPDADRFAAAERKKGSDGWNVFNGNEIGTLLASGKKLGFIASVVSSHFLKAVAAAEGAEFGTTHTGFKWISNKTIELEQKGIDVLVSYEQSIGYSLLDVVRDKDGPATAGTFVEMASQYAKEGLTLSEKLRKIYDHYGWFVSRENYVFVPSPALMTAFFAKLRQNNKPIDNFESLLGIKGKIEGGDVSAVSDYTNGTASDSADGTTGVPAVPETEHLAFSLGNGSLAQIRGSGTEPKLKFYVEAKGKTQEEAAEIAEKIATNLVEKVLMADGNGFVLPDTLKEIIKNWKRVD